MVLDRRIQNIVIETSKVLKTDISILDETSEIVLSNDPKVVGQIDDDYENIDFVEQTMQYNGKIYAKLENDNNVSLILCVQGSEIVSLNYTHLLKSLIEETLKTSKKKPGREEIYKRILLDHINPLELHEAIRDYKIEADADRCVILVQTVEGETNSVHNLLNEIFRMQEGDMVVRLNRYVVALVKSVDEDSDMESLRELVYALDETLNNEVALQAYIGAGGIKSGIVNIHDSYNEAMEAISLGLMQRNDTRIFLFHKLLLERFMENIPRDIRKRFHEVAYSDSLKKVLTDEMLATVLKFFENNLNLSEAARKLYIHRNTLIYRLEKIQRITGFDLRNFDDAVLLKIIIMLHKSLSSRDKI